MKRGKRPEYVVGLDVGTTKICAVIAEPRAGGLDVVGVGAAPSEQPSAPLPGLTGFGRGTSR